ncbi:MAG: serine--tRNA ligase [Candidatus Saccharimonadales bacterium]
MVDIQFIRENAELVQKKSDQKGYSVSISELLEVDNTRREIQTTIESLRAERNELASQMKTIKPTSEQSEKGKSIKAAISEQELLLNPINKKFSDLLRQVPNISADDVPIGTSENDNEILRYVGSKPDFDFTPLSDGELGLKRGIIDKERATKIAGSRFAYIKGDLVLLQLALIQFTLAVLGDESVIKGIIDEQKLSISSKAFIPVLPPAVATTAVYEATGRLNSEEQTYKLSDDDLWLNASAEHTLCPMYMNEVLVEDELPIRYVGYTTAFRREAGTYGKDSEGLFRMHQFDKLEMEVFSTKETSYEEHILLVGLQEYLLKKLSLPYRVVQKCTADIGKPNIRGIDIDTWMPAQNDYRETHTADYIGDYQTRELKTKVKRMSGETELLHTNDATAFAFGRIMKAIIENNQTKDGTIKVPVALQPYMNSKEEI